MSHLFLRVARPPREAKCPVSRAGWERSRAAGCRRCTAITQARFRPGVREATRPWSVPLQLVFAARYGQSFSCFGGSRCAVWRSAAIGRLGPSASWTGVIPFDRCPHQIDPPRGFVVTAKRLAGGHFPYPLSGTCRRHRARRIREQLEAVHTGRRETRNLQLYNSFWPVAAPLLWLFNLLVFAMQPEIP